MRLLGLTTDKLLISQKKGIKKEKKEKRTTIK